MTTTPQARQVETSYLALFDGDLVKIPGLGTVLLFCLSLAASGLCAQTIDPGAQWLDDRGNVIQGHGGSIVLWKGLYYWFGENYLAPRERGNRHVACYSSPDLVHWKAHADALELADPERLGEGWILERPKVFPNRRTGKFVMYFHLDDKPYAYAHVGVAVSDRIDGPYKYVRSFRPLDQESRDIGQFTDDDGSAYLIFESRPTKGFFIAKLSDDFLSVEKQVSFIEAPLEGGILVHLNGIYYVGGSHLTGWAPNPDVYATAPALSGPWSAFHDIAPPETNTYGAQTSVLLKIAGSKKTTVIFMGDLWHPKELSDSRYLWMPLEIGNGTMRLPAPRKWRVDIRSGQTQLFPEGPQTK